MLSIKRHPARFFTVLALVFLLATLMSAALSVRLAIINTDFVLRSRLPAIAIIGIDNDAIDYYARETGVWPDTLINISLVHEIASLPYVYRFDYGIWAYVHSYDIRRTFGEQVFIDAGLEPEGAIDIDSLSWSFDTDLELFWLRGTQSPELIDVSAGLIELSAGRSFTQEEIDTLSYVAIVSQDFLDENNLSVGSYLELDFSIYDFGEGGTVLHDIYSNENLKHSEAITLEIVGAFTKELTSNEGHHIQTYFDILNRIYVPNSVTESLNERYAEVMIQSVPEDGIIDGLLAMYEDLKSKVDPSSTLFLLHDPTYLPNFNLAATALLPGDWFVIEDRADAYADIARSMEMMRNIADGLAIGTLCATVIILSLLILLFVIDRKKEIGIYLAMGEKRGQVFAQLSTEVLIPCIIAVTLALFVGNMLSAEVSHMIMEQDLIAQIEDPERLVHRGQLYHLGFQIEMTPEEMMSAYEVRLDIATVTLFYGVMMVVVFLSILIPVLYMTRLDPKKILM